MGVTRSVMVALAVAVVTTGCESPPEVIWTSPAVASPDDGWTAQVREAAYDRGLFSEFGLEVTLARRAAAEPTVVLVLDGDWRRVNGGSGDYDSVRLRWTGGRTLEVSVPNLTEYFYRLTEHDGVQVRLVYRDDNPKVRGEWVRHRLERDFRR